MGARLLLILFAVAFVGARVIDDDHSKSNLEDIAHDIEKEARIEENEIDVFESDEYNHWVEKLLQSFSTKNHVDTKAADKTLLAVTSSIVSNAASFDMEHAIDEAFIHQCGADQYNDRAREISDAIASKNQCLMDVQRKLTRHFRQPRGLDLTVKDKVASQLACSVVPEVLTCFDPILKLLLSCTDDVEVGLPIYHEFKDAILQQYCANDAEIAADLISKTPATCISQGLDYVLKFVGPAFIRKLPIVSSIEYPCAISQYLRQVTSVMLPMQCNASSFVKLISHYTQLFNENIGCLDLYLR